MAPSNEVRLVVPAQPESLRLARVTAAELAGHLGFGDDEADDLRLAIDELCFALVGPTGRHGTVELVYLIDEGTLIVEGTGHFLEDIVPITLTDLSRVILGALVDEYDLSSGPDGWHFRFVKRNASPLGWCRGAGTMTPIPPSVEGTATFELSHRETD